MNDYRVLNYGKELPTIPRKMLSNIKAWYGLFLLLFLIILPVSAFARNPDLSLWTLNLSESSATTELGDSDYNQEIAVEGTTVHVIWMTEDKSDISIRKIFYRRSTDNGNTWDAKQLIYSSTSDSSILGDNIYKRMTVQNNSVHIFISDKDDRGIYIRSTNNGLTFEAPRTLISNDWHVYDTFITSDNGNVTIGFRNQCNYNDENAFLIFNSGDNGATFTQRTVYQATEGSHHVWDMQRFGNNIYALYSIGILHRELYLVASSDGGLNFKSTLISIPSKDGNHKTGALQDYHYVPKISGVGNTVHVIWNGLDGENVDSVFFRRSTNSGSTFENVINLRLPTGKAPQSGQETLAAAGNHVYAVICSKASNVYFRRSDDSGISFKEIQELTTKNADYIDNGWWPMIALDPASDGNKVHVLWMWPTYCVSTDGGATFTKPELVSPHFSYSGATINGAIKPQMTIGQDGKFHFVVGAKYYASSFGGYGDFDIFYRGLTSPPSPSEVNMSLKLLSSKDDNRFDNMQVPASGYLNFTSQMTAEVWVKQFPGGVNTGATLDIKPIFHKDEKDNSFHYFSYSMSTRGGTSGRRLAACQINTSAGDSWLIAPDDATGILEDGVWNHLAMTYDAAGGANNLKLYRNGKLIASKTATGNLDTRDGLFFAGRYGVWEIDDLRLWNVARTESQIKADMSRQLTGGETGLNAYYTFNNTTKDITGHGNDGILMYKETWIPYTPATVLSVSPKNQNVSKETGTTTFSVSNTGTGTMPWTAAVTSGGGWLSIQSGASGSNTGTITCAYTANAGSSARIGTIRVTAPGASGSPMDVTVTQAGTPAQPVLSVSPATRDVTKDAGTTTFTVSNTGTGTMPWTAAVTSSGGWLSIQSGASGANSGTITCAYTSNTASSSRTGTIRVTAAGATGSPKDVTVTQAGSTPTEIVFQPSPGKNDGTDDGSLNAGKDAYFYNCGDTWSGTSIYLTGYPRNTCNDCLTKAYIQFNVTTLPVNVDKVYLGVTHDPHTDYCYSMCQANFYFYPVLSSWNEVSFPQSPPQEGSAVYGPLTITFPNDFGKKEYDITEIYRKWKSGEISNNGLVIYSPDKGCGNAGVSWTVYSSDHADATKRPYLRVISGQPEQSASQFLGAWTDGVWMWNKATNKWTMMASTANAAMIAAGKVDADSIDDLIGVWATGLYVRQSTNGQWIKLSTSLPTWIAVGDLNNDGRDDVVGSWSSSGVYYRNSINGSWIKLSSPAQQLASGNIGGTRDDLAGVWRDGLWVRYSADASWKKIDSGIPFWITVGDMTGDKRADIVGSYSNGTWYRNSANGAWVNLTTPAAQLATGDLDGDGRDDLVGIWSNSVYVRYGATGQWQQISTSKPKWIATGKMMQAIQSEVPLDDPTESGEDLLDLSGEGPDGYHSAASSETDGPMIPE